MEVLGSQHVPQCGGGQQPGGLVGVLHVDHGVHRVENLEVNHSINSHSTSQINIGIEKINKGRVLTRSPWSGSPGAARRR